MSKILLTDAIQFAILPSVNALKPAEETRPAYQAVIEITSDALAHVRVALNVLMDVLAAQIQFAIQF